MLASSAHSAKEQENPDVIAPEFQDLVIGLVYYAGAITETFCADLQTKLKDDYGYEALDPIKISSLIEERNRNSVPTVTSTGMDAGQQKLDRVIKLQDFGDEMRAPNPAILASLAVDKIINMRGGPPALGTKRCFIIDSLKHRSEVDLLRLVYGHNFRLIAIHCGRKNRLDRLEKGKFRHAKLEDIVRFIDRDEQDNSKNWGQEVNKVFHQADYFIDNDQKQDGVKYAPDLARFLDLCVKGALLRPTAEETGMYYAHAASLQSSCLSRQVGAAILATDGRVLATGTNEVPKFGGGVYKDGDPADHRCFQWKDWCLTPKDPKYKESPVGEGCCHNTRRKKELRTEILEWLGVTFGPLLAAKLVPEQEKLFDATERQRVEDAVKSILRENTDALKGMPGIKDIIEYSRSIHAEMDALMNALRSGTSTVQSILFTTTYPCHNCARHIVAAGVIKVYYMEPFVKSLAIELHHDSLVNEDQNAAENKRVAILAFTGVGPRLYSELFLKEGEWKDSTGRYVPPSISGLRKAIQLDSLEAIERRAAALSRKEPQAQ